MEEYSAKEGIFIISESMDSKFMIECLQSLLSVCPGIKFTSVVSNADVGGYRVCFEDSEIITVLEKRFITVATKQIPIHPSETYLMIHDIDLNGGNKFESDLTNAIDEKFGRVLCFDRSRKLTETALNSFLVLVDVPEMKDLNIFSQNRYPQMMISVPVMSKNFKVSFWCRRCRHHGHTLKECFERPQTPIQEQTHLQGESSRSEINTNSKEQSDQDSFYARQLLKYPTNFPESTDIFATKLGRELAMHQARSIGEEGSSNQNVDRNITSELFSRVAEIMNLSNDILANENVSKRKDDQVLKTVNPEFNTRIKKAKRKFPGIKLFPTTEIKKEIPDETFQSEQHQLKDTQCRTIEPFGNSSRSGIAKHNTVENTEKKEHIVDARPFSVDATSTITDDDIQVIDDESSNREDTSRDSNVQSDSIKREQTIPDQNMFFQSPPVTPLASNQVETSLLNPGSSTYSPQQNQMTSCLSDRLHDCINRAYERYGILDKRTLDAFLIHVKKKSNPMRVASNYTANVQGLKDQLKQILFFYYNTPQTGTKEDSQFIKWLNGLVERFDGSVPRKRKSAARDNGGTLRKRMS